MRQFKFRGYDKVNKRMFEIYGLGQDWVTENTFDGVCEGQNYWADESFFNDIEVMMSTGIKKDGVDIYAGDIFFDEIEENDGDRRIFYVVTWINERASFALLSIVDGEYENYIEQGIEGIERGFEGFYYELDKDSFEKMHYKGHVFNNEKLLSDLTQ